MENALCILPVVQNESVYRRSNPFAQSYESAKQLFGHALAINPKSFLTFLFQIDFSDFSSKMAPIGFGKKKSDRMFYFC